MTQSVRETLHGFAGRLTGTDQRTMFILQSQIRTPANVADSWRRLESWLSSNAPEISATLRPGCSSSDLKAFEKRFAISLPDDVKESFRIHDGQELDKAEGPLVGQPLDPLERVSSSLMFYRRIYEEEQQSDHSSGLGDRATSSPPDAIQCEFATPNWISLGDWNSNCYEVDLNPGPNGVQGQVINFGRDENDKYVLALTWAHFLEDIADELEAGNLVISRSKEGEIEFFGRPGSEDQALFAFYREWSEAKLPHEFQQVQPIARESVLSGVVIQNETADKAIALVGQFVTAMHEYEMNWLKTRPIHELGWKLIQESSSGHLAEGIRDAERRVPIEKLEIHKYSQQAIRQKKTIVKRFCTARKRVMQDTFVQRYPLEYDPNRDLVAEVREVSPDHLIVQMRPVDGVTTRFHLAKCDDQWLLDYKDRTTDQLSFVKRSL